MAPIYPKIHRSTPSGRTDTLVLPRSLRNTTIPEAGCTNRKTFICGRPNNLKKLVGSARKVGELGFASASAAEIASQTHNALSIFLFA